MPQQTITNTKHNISNNNTMRKEILSLCLLLATTSQAKDYTIQSPDGALRMVVTDQLTYSLYRGDTPLLQDSRMGLDVRGEKSARVVSAKSGKTDRKVEATFYRQQIIADQCSTLTLRLNTKESVEVRAYNSGVAYRFTTSRKGEYIIDNEVAQFKPAGSPILTIAHTTGTDRPLQTAFQNTYRTTPLSQADTKLGFLPAVLDYGTCKLTLMESDLEAYPGMFINVREDTLEARFAPVPTATTEERWRHQEVVTEAADYMAVGNGQRTFPWRIMAVSADDRQMPVNDLVYLLADANRIGDTQWIKPGKVAWDWWYDWSIEGVDFRAGINTQTYKYLIDFAARYGLEYVILDEGWYAPKSGDMLTVVPDIDLPELVRYGEEKGVGLILWTVFKVLDNQLDEACTRYSKMGVKGFKVDFLDRDDQRAVEMVYRIAETCARHHLLLDYHGIYKPTGINRTFPHIINFESVFGMEEVKWTAHGAQDMPRYDVTFPYIRMQSGFVDFTPGGMRNATRNDFQPVYSNPMTMGTRAHQAAHYVVHDSPLTMLADSPSAYDKEPDYTRFIAQIPVTWDETRIVCGTMGESIVTARRKGNDWYVGGETSWEARDIRLPLDFLTDGVTYEATMVEDGLNADKIATDYTLRKQSANNQTILDLHLASGGGFAIKLEKK